MKKVRKAVIPVAGLGTRFLPITKGIAKELLPIVDKPSLQYIIEECVNSGIEEIYLITSNLKPEIEAYFSKDEALEQFLIKKGKVKELEMVREIPNICKLHYLIQEEPLGSGHAVSLIKDYIDDEPFAVVYGDDLMMSEKPILKQLIEVYEQYDCNVIGVRKVADSEVNRYGIIEFDGDTDKIKSLVEKPSLEEAPSNYAGLGRYIFKPEMLNELSKIPLEDGEYKLTTAMEYLMGYQPFYTCKFEGKYYDIGNKLGYLKANIEFALKRDEFKNELEIYLNK